MKKTLLSIAVLSTILLAGCSFIKTNNTWDNDDFIVCTEEEKNATACNMQYEPVCGDNNKTYWNACVACSSHEISWYIKWECYEACDNEEWICTVEDLQENNEEETPVVSAPSSQVVGIELTVVAPDEEESNDEENIEQVADENVEETVE